MENTINMKIKRVFVPSVEREEISSHSLRKLGLTAHPLLEELGLTLLVSMFVPPGDPFPVEIVTESIQ